MCGIVGVAFSDPLRMVSERVLDDALGAIKHRGPDGEGRLVRPGIAAGMRRLAIIDVDQGNQPIFGEDGSVGVIFNGEIYNYRELRRQCEARGHHFQSMSDTEVLVHLYEDEGPDFLPRLNGMFAFLLWDSRRQTAILARDRFGIKPLYLCNVSGGIAFASEVKSLAALGVTEPSVSHQLLADYLRYLWVPDPETAWKGVSRLAPGTYLTVERGVPQKPRRYHKLTLHGEMRITLDEAAAEVGRLVRAAVQRQLVADVPVGALLSGGLDSSLLVANAVGLGAQIPAHTIRINRLDAARDPFDDDAEYAASVARELGLEHHVYDVAPRIVDLLPRLLRHADDPVADPAIINAFLICDAARSHSKVLLSGMGADELAGGYRRHIAANLLRPLYRLPAGPRRALISAAQRAAGALRFQGLPGFPVVRRAAKALNSLAPEPRQLALQLARWTPRRWIEQLGLVESTIDAQFATIVDRINTDFSDPLDIALAFDITSYLPGHNLRYMDKMSMAASVEVRVPFLDNELVDFLLKLPRKFRVTGTSSKRVLRRAAAGVVPSAVLNRPKTGFGAPIRSWLAGPVRQMAHDLLSPAAVRRRGLLDPLGVHRLLLAHDRNNEDLAYTVWALLAFEVWCQQHDKPAVKLDMRIDQWSTPPNAPSARDTRRD